MQRGKFAGVNVEGRLSRLASLGSHGTRALEVRCVEGHWKDVESVEGGIWLFTCKASKVCLAFMCGIPIAESNGHLIGGLLRRCPSRRLFDTVASLAACSAGVLIGA